jgi:hypothetical protein
VIRHLAGTLIVFLLRVMSFVLPVFLYHIGKDYEIYNTAYFISQGVFIRPGAGVSWKKERYGSMGVWG